MEGYTDVIAAHQAGFDNAVAPLGTAVTREQLSLATRYGEGVTLVLDGDEAGQKAAERGVNVMLEAGIDGKVAVLKGAKDPFDLIRSEGPEAFQRVLDTARDAFDFKLDVLRARYDLSRPVEAEKALRELAEMIGRAESATLRQLYARKAAASMQLREAVVMSAVEAEHTKIAGAAAKAQPKQEDGQGLAAGNRAAYERELLRRLFEFPGVLGGAGETLLPDCFQTPALRELYREMLNTWDEHHELVAGSLVSHLGNEARAELAKLEDANLPSNQAQPVDRTQEEERLNAEIQKLAGMAKSSRPAQDLKELRQRKGRRDVKKA
jgi:DNA primase